MNCAEALPCIHEYLDGDLSGEASLALKKHLISCISCHQVFKQLEHTEALVMRLPKKSAPDNLMDRIMQALPKPQKRNTWAQWIKRHPAISVASVFLVVMMGSFLSMWNQDTEMVLKGANLDQVIIQGDRVYVPAGHTINGNLMVKRGKIQVDGEVKGDLVVIDGSYNLASTAHISGQIKMVNKALEWLWFEMNDYMFAK
jgi:anti-sigma factor RsiW